MNGVFQFGFFFSDVLEYDILGKQEAERKSGVVSTALEIDKKLEIISTSDNLRWGRQIDNKK